MTSNQHDHVRVEIRLEGHLDTHWSPWFGGLVMAHEADGCTTLRGSVTDQAQLYGVLARIRDLGATLVSLIPLDIDGDEGAEAAVTGLPPARPALDAIAWPTHTRRLTLRPATAADLDATWDFRRREDVSRWLTRAPATLAEYRTQFLDPASLGKSLVVELAGAVIGDLMLQVVDAWGQAEVAAEARGVQAELGWVLHPDHAGRGYASEAVRELLRLGFEELGLRRMTASCFAANVPSWRLMERVGMRREVHAVRESLHRSGEWLDGFGYAILAEEHRRAVGGVREAAVDRRCAGPAATRRSAPVPAALPGNGNNDWPQPNVTRGWLA